MAERRLIPGTAGRILGVTATAERPLIEPGTAGPILGVTAMADIELGTTGPILGGMPKLGDFDIHVPLIKMKKTRVIIAQFTVLRLKRLVRPVNVISNSDI